MKAFLVLTFFSLLCPIYGQQCQARFNRTITGQCSIINNCQGTLLSGAECRQGACCVSSPYLSAQSCLTANQFDVSFNNTIRATFLRSVLNSALVAAGICSNCQAKAAFLAIAAAKTDNFQTDESTKSDIELSADDNKYGNTQEGDGSRFRQRGLFGLRGRTMYERVQTALPQIRTLDNPESAAIVENAAAIAARLWRNPDLLSGRPLTEYSDGSFYGFSMIWYKLFGDMDKLAEATQYYSKFLRLLECGGELYQGQGPSCQYNATHVGKCSPDCITGMEELGSSCGCIGEKVSSCSNSPPHVKCCVETCSQELKMDLGFVLDASGSVGSANYNLQLTFTKDLLRRANVGPNKTHVGIINYSNQVAILTRLNADYTLQQKLSKVDTAIYYSSGTDTALALRTANQVFSYANGRRSATEGVTPVIFVITDGASNDVTSTIQAAQILKNQDIILVSVGVGSGPNLYELHQICSPPISDNYFAISNYNALDQKLNQFTSKSCSEPAPVPWNNTVTVEVGKDKYKFLKVEIVTIGNKIQITVTLFNGNVNIFYSFTNKNPKDPKDFTDYSRSPKEVSIMKTVHHVRPRNNQVTLVIDKPNEDADAAYIGIKGLENDNKFEVKFDDCDMVDCKVNFSVRTSINVMLMIIAALFLLR